MTGFEPAASRPPGERATGLRYIPKKNENTIKEVPFIRGTQRKKLFFNSASQSLFLFLRKDLFIYQVLGRLLVLPAR